MSNNTIHDLPRIPSTNLDYQELIRFFISHLNRIYCAKSQLVDKLPLIGRRSHFRDLQQAIDGTVEEVRGQIGRLKDIYVKLGTSYKPESCIGLVGFLDEAFQSIGPPFDSPALRDLSILFYMQNIESIEMASFQIMMQVADKLQEPATAQLLRECFDEAREDKALFKAIADHYL
jgi:ferritin-like metal-binding protein YciE